MLLLKKLLEIWLEHSENFCMNEYLFVNGTFEVNRIFVIKAETEEQAYDILCEKQNITESDKENARKYHKGILIEYTNGYFETDDF